MLKKTNNILTDRRLQFCGMMLFSFVLSAQQDPLFTQYMNNPLMLNPAFAGSRNSLAMDLSIRQQWMGIEGAPTTYYFGVHSPINHTKISLGGTLISDQAGPVISNQMSFAYSYLLRINHRTFLSLGLSAGINNYWVNLNNLEVIDQRDPHFSSGIENQFRPTFGSGAVLFTPAYYFSVSVPQAITSKISHSHEDAPPFQSRRHYYFTGGYRFEFAYDYTIKFSGIARIAENDINTYDIHTGIAYKDFLELGAAYRHNNSAAIILGIQINQNWGISYSYDFPVQTASLNRINNQEITITFDSFHLFVRNRDREFLRKRTPEEEPSVRSIRYF